MDPWRSWSERWETAFREFIHSQLANADVGHDAAHVLRVVRNTERIGREEAAQPEIAMAAAWLHDCVVVPKDSSMRTQASRMAAQVATQFLQGLSYPVELHAAIEHAIAAHSFSANIPPETLEARVVQDADRLEALGAIGLVRCLSTGVAMGIAPFDPAEPFPAFRQANDRTSSVDHLFVKLLRLPARMQTSAGQRLAVERNQFLLQFLQSLAAELYVDPQHLRSALDQITKTQDVRYDRQ